MSFIKRSSIYPLLSLSKLEFLLGLSRRDLGKLSKTAGAHYNPYDIHKKGTNKWRHIDNPKKDLKIIQKKILKQILNTGVPILPEGMAGGVTGKSVVENAKKHIGKECIAIVDIKECFPSINHLKIYKVWKNTFGCGEKTLGILTQLTTFQDRLPQGAPTSSLLCNFALLPIFNELSDYSKKHNLSVSVFIDDITVSGTKKEVTFAVEAMVKILRNNEYAVRNKKIKIISAGFRQKITGVTTNRKLSIGRKEIEEIRDLILETAKIKDFIPSNINNSIYGKISFAKLISKPQGSKLERFANQILILPILPVIDEKDERRECNKYRRDHRYTL